jgi:hypothetical protein
VKEILDYRNNSHTLESVVEHHSMNFLLIGGDSAERVNTAVVSANFFDVLGVKPLLGRTFVPGDEDHGADAVLILSYPYWKSRYGGDPNIVGRVFQMNNRPHTVIGVLPPIPQYPVEKRRLHADVAMSLPLLARVYCESQGAYDDRFRTLEARRSARAGTSRSRRRRQPDRKSQSRCVSVKLWI